MRGARCLHAVPLAVLSAIGLTGLVACVEDASQDEVILEVARSSLCLHVAGLGVSQRRSAGSPGAVEPAAAAVFEHDAQLLEQAGDDDTAKKVRELAESLRGGGTTRGDETQKSIIG